MNTEVVERDGVRIVRCTEEIGRVDDAVELISACFEASSRRLLIESRYLPEVFFDLSTRFAGEFLQKLQNYRIRIAITIDASSEHSDRFKEFLAEAKGGKAFRAFEDMDEAEKWLCSE
ncbi:MAG: DUF4180 domain-containing protein [Acidimicrobiia bacterium]